MIIFSPNTIAKSAEVNANFVEVQGMAGEIRMFGGTSAPTSWLLCQGQAISRTVYAALYAVIGTTYGVGNGSTTFNIPNLGGNTPVGYKSGDANFGTLGAKVGTATHTLSSSEMPAHSHTINNAGTHTHGGGNTGTVSADHSHSFTTSNNGSHTHVVKISGSNNSLLYSEMLRGGMTLSSSSWSYSGSVDTQGDHNHSGSTGGISANHTHSITSDGDHGHTSNNTGSGSAHNNIQPSQVVNFIIKY